MASYQAGFNAKARFNSTAYAIATYQCRAIGADLDVTNTENIPGNPLLPGNVLIGGEACIAGLQRLEATVRAATFDVLSNPFAAPISVVPATFLNLRIYVNLVGGVSWQAPSFFVREASIDQDVTRLQPVSFQGRSDGNFSIPAT